MTLIRSVGSLLFGLAVVLAPAARAQAPNALSLARVAAARESSSTARRSWAGTGAILGGVGGGVVFFAAFYHFTHRTGGVNGTTGTLGGAVAGASFGAVGGALLGAFIGSLIPKHRE